MAFSSKLLLRLLLSSLFIHGSIAEIVCEELPKEVCSFSIASSGKRCLLETAPTPKDGSTEHQCRTSEVVVERMAGYIESDQCVKACGVDRKTVGISSDALFESKFTIKLCSPACYRSCPNIVDLYFNLASGEGAFLPDLCKKPRNIPRREMAEFQSFGRAAQGPMSSEAPVNREGSISSPPASSQAASPAPDPGSDEDEPLAPAPSVVDGEMETVASF